MILDDEQPQIVVRRRRFHFLRMFRLPLNCMWESYDKTGAPVQAVAPGTDLTAMQFHKRFADGQSEPKSRLRMARALFEGVEDADELFRSNANTLVFDLNDNMSGLFLQIRMHLDRAALRAEFHRIREQIPEDLLKP